MFRNFSILLAGLMFLGMSCRKRTKAVQDNIPYQTVNMTIYPNDPLYFKLQAVGGWVYVKGGINGIIVYRKAQNSSADFIAIERTSSYYPDDSNAAVQVQSDNFTLKDPVSGSTWQIIDAAVSSGPAQLPLRVYSSLYDNGTGGLLIRN